MPAKQWANDQRWKASGLPAEDSKNRHTPHSSTKEPVNTIHKDKLYLSSHSTPSLEPLVTQQFPGALPIWTAMPTGQIKKMLGKKQKFQVTLQLAKVLSYVKLTWLRCWARTKFLSRPHPDSGLEGVLSPFSEPHTKQIWSRGAFKRHRLEETQTPFSFQSRCAEPSPVGHKAHFSTRTIKGPTKGEMQGNSSPRLETHTLLVSIPHGRLGRKSTWGPLSCRTWSPGSATPENRGLILEHPGPAVALPWPLRLPEVGFYQGSGQSC